MRIPDSGRLASRETGPPAAIETDPTETATSGEGWSMSISNLSASTGDSAQADTSADPERVHLGTLTSVSDDTVVQTGSGELPPVGTTRNLSKQVTRQLGTASFETWLKVARVEVIETSRSTVTLRVLEETSVVHVNGRKIDHFTEGATTRLVW